MPRIGWPACSIDAILKAVQVDHSLATIVALEAERLNGTEPELVVVATMRDNVIGDSSHRGNATIQAHLTERLELELMLSTSIPARGPVPLPVLALLVPH
jgi:hypothetical protein